MTINETKKTNKLNKTGSIVLAIIIIIGFLFAIIQCNTNKNKIAWSSSSSNKINFWASFFKPEYIAILEIEGVIQDANANYNQKWLLDTIDELKKDTKNKALMIVIDSPGGAIYEADEAYLALKDYANQKPLYAYFKSVAASGGYYIACAANHITANRNTLTGSIGVISGNAVDLTKMFENFGIKMTTFHSGKNKNMLNYNEPVTQEQRNIMQAISDDCYEQFTEIVSTERNLSLSKVKNLADGRIYTAKQALDLSLIDKIGSLDEAIAVLQNDAIVSPTIHKETFSYKKKKSLWESLVDVRAFIPNKMSETEFVLNLIDKQISFPAYYYEP